MATLAARYDGETIEHYSIRWNEDLTGAQRAAIATELERDRFIPQYQWLKIGDLYVDESYQRPLSPDRVWSIVKEFTWSLYDPLWIGDRKGRGTLYVVDGRHRLAASSVLREIIPKQLVPCQVRRTESVEEEARIFIDLQEKRRIVTSAQRFAAKLAARDEHALILDSIISKHKFKVPTNAFGGNGTTAKQNEILAVGTLEQIYRAGGRNRVNAVLMIIREAWDGVAPTTSAWMLRSVNRLLEREPGKNPDTLARKLRVRDPWGLIERGMRFAHSNGIPTSEAMADVLIKVTE